VPSSESINDGSDDQSDSDSGYSDMSDSFYESDISSERSYCASRSESDRPPLEVRPKPIKSPKKSIGPFWELNPCPLSKKEERKISQNQRFSQRFLPFGPYKVAPNRYDLQNFQRIFWIGREIRQLLIVISLSSTKQSFNDSLLFVRNQIFLLGNGSGKLTAFQRKLFASVYFCLRQCSTDYKSRVSSNRAIPPHSDPSGH
jgi:hypothetical protein